jgi:hypothetical protein
MQYDLGVAHQRPAGGIRADHSCLTGRITEVFGAKRGQQSSELFIEVLQDGPGCSSPPSRIARRK